MVRPNLSISTSSHEFKPGQILAFKKQGLLGIEVSLAEGGAQDTHVAIILPNGKLGSTGAKFLLWYGEVDPRKYCKGRSFDVLEPLSPYTQEQLDAMDKASKVLLKSFWGRIYGAGRYFQLYWESITGDGDVPYVGKLPAPDPPRYYICSWVVGYLLEKAGIRVGKLFGKVNYTGLAPSDFEREVDAIDAIGPSPVLETLLHRVARVRNYKGV